MKRVRMMNRNLMVMVLLLVLFRCGAAQGFGTSLTMQGLDQSSVHSAASRGAGGMIIGFNEDVGMMFANPSALQNLQSVRISVGGVRSSADLQQAQQYGIFKYYSNLSLLLEGLTGYIGNPDTTKFYLKLNTVTQLMDTVYYVKLQNAGDTVQRPFDKLGPNWSHKKTRNLPLQAFVAAPFSIGDFKFAAGLGAVEYANLDWYFQNNNVLSPSILSLQQHTIDLPANNTTTSLPVEWYQYAQSREGTIQGYGGALSVAVTEGLSLGVSAMLLKGTTDDLESRIDRGKIVFYASYFRLDSVYNHVLTTGTSDYSGQEYTLSGTYASRFLTLAVSAKPPMTVTRKYSAVVLQDTMGTSRSNTVSGEDKLELPWRGTIGASLAIRDNIRLAVGYEIKSYASASYQNAAGVKSNPWRSSYLFHAGAEIAPASWLVLRAGVHEYAEGYESEGNPLAGEPVSGTVYSAGFGMHLLNIHLNLAYEYSDIKYQDMWANAVSLNEAARNSVAVDVAYDLPF